MADQKSEIRYLTAPSIDTKKKKYCRFKKSGCSGAYYMVPHYTDGIRSVDWFVRYNDGHIGRSVYYTEYQNY